jgi:hypothetical protein
MLVAAIMSQKPLGFPWHQSTHSKQEDCAMARSEVCGNDYDKSFTIALKGDQHVFDSFECAIRALAPQCGHCHCRLIGHGVEGEGKVYCCANCARQAGLATVADRAA